jgi:hypothetical protein
MENKSNIELVIDRLSTIENNLDQIISNFIRPKESSFHFFWDVMLDSSILPIGSKIRLCVAIAQNLQIKVNPTTLHKLIALRNAFAHQGSNENPIYVIGKTDEDTEAFNALKVISQSGRISLTKREKAFEEFNENYRKSLDILLEIKEKLKEHESK